MTKEEKRNIFAPKRYNLYENGEFIDSFPSHSEAKKAKYIKNRSACADMLDLTYTIKPAL